jgi:hypothetical protein
MSLLNPVISPSMTSGKAASLRTTLSWYFRHGWEFVEAYGRRRASRELQRLGSRLKRDVDLQAHDPLPTATQRQMR